MLLKHFIKKHWQEGEESFELPAVSSEEKVFWFAVAEWVCVLYSVFPQNVFILLEGIKTFKVHHLVWQQIFPVLLSCSPFMVVLCIVYVSWSWFLLHSHPNGILSKLGFWSWSLVYSLQPRYTKGDNACTLTFLFMIWNYNLYTPGIAIVYVGNKLRIVSQVLISSITEMFLFDLSYCDSWLLLVVDWLLLFCLSTSYYGSYLDCNILLTPLCVKPWLHYQEVIRKLLLLSLDDTQRKICTAISMAVASIAVYDWPEDWPDLLPVLLKLITDQSNMNGGEFLATSCLSYSYASGFF